MSWQDQIKNNIKITAANGRVFNVVWDKPSVTTEWNGAKNAFLEIPGTLAKKKKLLGREFPLEFYFQGPNNVADSLDFNEAMDDVRPVTIDHPYYGIIIASLFSINLDHTALNLTRVTSTAIETISEQGVVSFIDPIDNIALFKSSLDDINEAELTEPPSISDVNTLQLVTQKNYKEGLKIITLPADAQAYFNAFSAASSAINVATASPLLAMRATIAMINLPAQFLASVKYRLNALVNQFNILRTTLQNLFTVPSKQIYEIQGNALISAICVAAVSPLSGNYRNKPDALGVIKKIIAVYQQFLADLDVLQDPNGGNPLYFIPGADALNQLNELVTLTVSSLLQIALNGRQERSVILTEDTDLIKFTHKYYGLDPFDNNINEIIENNSLTYHDMLILKKGRKMIYYT
jgi:hypothetical protein